MLTFKSLRGATFWRAKGSCANPKRKYLKKLSLHLRNQRNYVFFSVLQNRTVGFCLIINLINKWTGSTEENTLKLTLQSPSREEKWAQRFTGKNYVGEDKVINEISSKAYWIRSWHEEVLQNFCLP